MPTDDQLHSLDREATAVARAAVAGERDETEALWHIAALMSKAGIGQQVVRSHPSQPFDSENVAERLDLLIEQKLVGHTGASIFDLKAAARGKSATGWGRQLARAAYSSEVRNHRRSVAKAVPYDPSLLQEVSMRYTELTPDVPCTEEREESIGGITDEYQARTWGIRPEHVIHEQARAATRFLGVSQPPRVPPSRRATIRALNKKYEHLARSVAAQLAGLVDRPAEAPYDFEVAFNGYSTDELAAIAEMDSSVARLIVESAISPTPPPNVPIVREMLRHCERLVPSRAWRKSAHSLVNAFVAMVGESVPLLGASYEDKSATQIRRDRSVFEIEAAAVAAISESSMGSTVPEVETYLRTLMDRLETDAAMQREHSRFGV